MLVIHSFFLDRSFVQVFHTYLSTYLHSFPKCKWKRETETETDWLSLNRETIFSLTDNYDDDDDAVTQAEAAIEAKLRKGFLIPKK